LSSFCAKSQHAGQVGPTGGREKLSPQDVSKGQAQGLR
jgi:hypothetical protein